MPISIAGTNDRPALVVLMDNAYRGESSKKGWTTEAHLLQGDKRTDDATVSKLMLTPGAVFLKYTNDENIIEGCVFLHQKGNKLYLGMLSVSPLVQAKGIGKKLMAAAEEHARKQNCISIYMHVISLRHELIAWYERHGYHNTGEKIPFPIDERFGIPTQPLEFVVLEKMI